MAWNLTGELLESCSCNMFCPCWLGVKELMVMDQGWCDSTLLFRINEGTSDGINLSGRAVVIALDFPGPTLFDGSATARVYVDDATDQSQRMELEAIFQGKKGGPMEILGGLVARWLPTQQTKIDVQQTDGALSADVGSIGQIKLQRLANEEGQPILMQNGGFMVVLRFDNQTAQLAPSGTQWSDPEMPRSFETKSGAVGTVRWSGS